MEVVDGVVIERELESVLERVVVEGLISVEVEFVERPPVAEVGLELKSDDCEDLSEVRVLCIEELLNVGGDVEADDGRV